MKKKLLSLALILSLVLTPLFALNVSACTVDLDKSKEQAKEVLFYAGYNLLLRDRTTTCWAIIDTYSDKIDSQDTVKGVNKVLAQGLSKFPRQKMLDNLYKLKVLGEQSKIVLEILLTDILYPSH